MPVPFLEELTSDQWAEVGESTERIAAEVLTPGRADRARVEAGITACHAHLGRPEPEIIWTDGPISLGQFRGQSWDCPWDLIWDQLRGQLDVQVTDQLSYGIREHLWAQLRDQLWGQLWEQLWEQSWSYAGVQFRRQVRDQFRRQVGAHYWRSANALAPSPVGVEVTRLLDAWTDARSAGPWLSFRGGVIVSEKHDLISADPTGRPHCETGPVWSWRDGTEVWALDGIVVPDWAVLDPDPARVISGLPNTEQRRVALGHFGWDRVPEALDLKLLDGNPNDPHLGDLYRLPEAVAGSRANLLVARNGSPHRDGTWATYGLLCSPDATTAAEAQASLARLTPAEWLAFEGRS